jgi:hypothetical protein
MVQFSDIGDGQFVGTLGNLAIDPLFRNVAGGDYHLSPASLMKDAGVPAVGPLVAPDRDFRGELMFDDPATPNLNGGFHPMGYDDDSPTFIRGDANADTGVDIADAIFTLSYLFAKGTPPSCLDAADANMCPLMSSMRPGAEERFRYSRITWFQRAGGRLS